MSLGAIDLFCGAGGLTHGLEREGIDVIAGIDIDPICAFPYEANNLSRFVLHDVAKIDAAKLTEAWGDTEVRLLAGCAPCQPFSKYTQGRMRDERWSLLNAFSRLIDECAPELVTMENVPELKRHSIHEDFVSQLKALGYEVSETIVECLHYGIPQQRKRLVLLASKLGPIELISASEFGAKASTVRDVIGDLPPIAAGQAHSSDGLHRSSGLSEINLRRIQASRPGGSWSDWDKSLVANCHQKEQGKGYRSVYGRMEWDKPAPTITTQSFGFGSGRFGHPAQDRALSLREAAMLQTFPKNYKFAPDDRRVEMKNIGRLIGNAVPVTLGQVVGRSVIRHLGGLQSEV
ncbi:DNA cytosine methyltransferase [Pararhizobium antarcticum]|uniref:DNA (cytosine-5-)-methyltransferase n=1 Tax=Pararhizobium antarcticum TaxID=1798805 RepID=A0A657LXA5_9HYPH|nr:DNA cytosine methyltransferase [Pararhizobium antarcticum]OJF94122.1 DNA cytosine methyltransferase [Rhizobium sp. 58]OJF99608.1 DNA cytosine methyltransferase [Pararhizobium antarcticum]